ncbi:hypothetical protein [Parabacteroides merdae]|uniref:Uncharacterized protein n=1 Tax=Parabacteroides merdae TaxID=46503 RepID=A0A414BUN8_9BACT|nr:hypothetical protein [Parabacteroides merdae]RHC81484.1 hypothetical protein DW828_15540 [Parabacteroides merdae]
MNIKNRNDYISLKKELRFNSSDYQDTQVVDMTQKAVDYTYDNLKEPENIYEGYDIEFEAEITDIALSIDAHLQKNKKNKKSHVIRKFILDVINTEKYKKGRSGFIYLLYILKMDDSLKQIAIEKKDFWNSSRMAFQLLYALYRRKIRGFSQEAETLIMNFPKDTELKQYAYKYIEQQTNEIYKIL